MVKQYNKKPHALLVDKAHTLNVDVCQKLLTLTLDVSVNAPFPSVLTGTPGSSDFVKSVNTTLVDKAQHITLDLLDETSAMDAIRLPLEQSGITIDNDKKTLRSVAADSQYYPFFL